MVDEPYTLADSERETVLTVFLAWLGTEKSISLIKDDGEYNRNVYTKEYPDLIKEYCQWRKN